MVYKLCFHLRFSKAANNFSSTAFLCIFEHRWVTPAKEAVADHLPTASMAVRRWSGGGVESSDTLIDRVSGLPPLPFVSGLTNWSLCIATYQCFIMKLSSALVKVSYFWLRAGRKFLINVFKILVYDLHNYNICQTEDHWINACVWVCVEI